MEIKLNNRWDELEPEVQLALTRLINHIASTSNQHRCLDVILDGQTVDGFRDELRKPIGDEDLYRKGHADGVSEAIDHMMRFGE